MLSKVILSVILVFAIILLELSIELYSHTKIKRKKKAYTLMGWTSFITISVVLTILWLNHFL